MRKSLPDFSWGIAMQLYGDIQSGNCYKVKLLASLLQIDLDWQPIDILAGDTQTPEFLALNPNGKIPYLKIDATHGISESNAILNYLAHGTEYLPKDPYLLAKVQQWQFFEQYSHEPYIAVARFISRYLGMPEARRAEYESKQVQGHKALEVMEQQLQKTPFLIGDQLTTADISLYGYTHLAEEGGFDLHFFPAIQQWLYQIHVREKEAELSLQI